MLLPLNCYRLLISIEPNQRRRAIAVINSVQLEVLKAKTRQKLPTILTVAWAVEAVAYLGGYLEHRRKTNIGIQVLWRGWLKLHDLCEGWELARNT